MRIEITAGGIFGADGEIPVGAIVDVKEEPKGWAGRYRVLADDAGKEPVTNEPTDRDELKKQAGELGIEYPKNISTEKLKELIDAKLAA